MSSGSDSFIVFWILLIVLLMLLLLALLAGNAGMGVTAAIVLLVHGLYNVIGWGKGHCGGGRGKHKAATKRAEASNHEIQVIAKRIRFVRHLYGTSKTADKTTNFIDPQCDLAQPQDKP